MTFLLIINFCNNVVVGSFNKYLSRTQYILGSAPCSGTIIVNRVLYERFILFGKAVVKDKKHKQLNLRLAHC